MQKAQATTYIKSLDGVRALSILLVILAHTAPLGPKFLKFNAMAGIMGMALFFCLSGYLMTSILYRKPDVFEFVVKRVLRIFPAVLVYLTILLIFFDLPWRSYIFNLLFVSNYVTDALSGGPVSHLWSLSVEMHFYAAISIAVIIGGRKALWLIPFAAVIVTLLRVNAGVYSNINTHLRVDEILSGGCLALASMRYGDKFRGWLSNNVLATALIVILWLLLMLSSHKAGGALNYVRPYIAASLVGVVIHSNLRFLRRILESWLAGYIARISYALYIYHPLMVYGFMNAGSTMERYLLKRPISYVLTWAAAHMSTFWWEQRWQKLAREKIIAARRSKE